MRFKLATFAALSLIGPSASAHRLDEYLQGTIISVTKNRMDAEMTLTPGVAVFPVLIADIDSDADGVISKAEQHAYAERVLREISLSVDGHPLTPDLTSAEFPATGEMQAGRGEIRIEFHAELPRGGANRKLIFENHHESKIAAYQVNALVPRDPNIHIVRQTRNYSQSLYELDFVQAGMGNGSQIQSFLSSARSGPVGTMAFVVVAWLALLCGLHYSNKREPTKN